MFSLIGIYLTTSLFNLCSPQQLTAKEIIEKSDQQMRGETARSELVIKIVRPNWTREMSAKTWSKGDDFSLILITSPAKEKGTAFLKRNNEVWNWVPSIERTVKLPPSMMMQSWMGTDFTNDDLVRESSIIEDYEHKILKDSVIDGRQTWKIELVPRPDAPVVWDKVYTWVDKENYLQLRSEFYDEDGYLINIMQASDIKKFDDRVIPSRLEMIPVDKKGHKTVLEYKSLEFNDPIEDQFFTVPNMRKLR